MDAIRIESLEDIWPAQAELNRRAGIDTARLGGEMSTAAEPEEQAPLGRARVEVGRALKNYLDALAAECHELQECLSWKHWYSEAKEGRQYELQDVQNARVEAMDMLFFWVSICQLLGLQPADVYRLYARKLEVNHRRQDENRSQAEHADHEGENLGVV
jgi:hypothetical protein